MAVVGQYRIDVVAQAGAVPGATSSAVPEPKDYSFAFRGGPRATTTTYFRETRVHVMTMMVMTTMWRVTSATPCSEEE